MCWREAFDDRYNHAEHFSSVELERVGFRGDVELICNLEHGFEADALLSNKTPSSITICLRAESNSTERFDIGFVEANLVAVDAQQLRTIYRCEADRRSLVIVCIVVSVLNQLQ